MKLLIQSVARSGTHYTTEFLNILGLKVEHEALGIDGTVRWQLEPHLPDNDYIFLHQTREPIATITSLHHINNDSWRYISRVLNLEITTPILQRCMTYYYKWHQILDERSVFTYPVEEIHELVEILDLFKINYDKDKLPKALELPKNINYTPETHATPKTELSWEALYRCDYDLAEKIEDLAKKYEYK
jgi:hypothetical protein